MPSSRLITEGVTDQITLEILLSIFYDEPDIDVERLQPPGDETDRYKQKKGEYGGEALNRQLARREGFTINRNKKDPRYYERITKKFRDKRNLLKLANYNPSFKIFLDNLPGIE
jgi:hypothetical protein